MNLLVGFEREAARNLTLSGQVFIQRMMDHDNAVDNSPMPEYLVDETHELYTVRLTYLALQQKLTLSVFAFYSRDAKDFYLKPKISYRYSDNLLYVFGFNEFGGEDKFTQWGQFEKSSNVYGRVKYTF